MQSNKGTTTSNERELYPLYLRFQCYGVLGRFVIIVCLHVSRHIVKMKQDFNHSSDYDKHSYEEAFERHNTDLERSR